MGTGDDGFAAANDGEDGVDVWGGEGVEVGAVVGYARGSFVGLGAVLVGLGRVSKGV